MKRLIAKYTGVYAEDDIHVYNHLQAATFCDEDLCGMLTAIAFQPMTEEEGQKRFGHLRLA